MDVRRLVSFFICLFWLCSVGAYAATTYTLFAGPSGFYNSTMSYSFIPKNETIVSATLDLFGLNSGIPSGYYSYIPQGYYATYGRILFGDAQSSANTMLCGVTDSNLNISYQPVQRSYWESGGWFGGHWVYYWEDRWFVSNSAEIYHYTFTTDQVQALNEFVATEGSPTFRMFFEHPGYGQPMAFDNARVTFTTQNSPAVPEPVSMALGLFGLINVGVYGKLRRKV